MLQYSLYFILKKHVVHLPGNLGYRLQIRRVCLSVRPYVTGTFLQPHDQNKQFHTKFLVFVETALGVKINAQGNDKSPFLVELNNLLQLACERIFHLWLQPDWLYKFFPQHKKHEHSVKALHTFTNEVRTRHQHCA